MNYKELNQKRSKVKYIFTQQLTRKQLQLELVYGHFFQLIIIVSLGSLMEIP